jgi:3-phosphoshikimate 1-carboxyvinyltransferase
MGGDVSSQFISAILMIAPVLPGGLALTLTGKITSRPYIDLTRRMMQHFGVVSHWEGATVVVPEQTYQPGHYTIESDWSAASYWYSLVALSPGSEVFLRGLREDSWQGDQQIATWMTHFGVHTTYESGGVRLTQVVPDRPDQLLVFDCHDTPDLAQTLAVLSAATGIPVQLEGLHTLRVKETDRIEAIRQELARFKVAVEVEGTTIRISGTAEPSPSVVNTYDDHRMAMAFAPLALRQSRLDMQGHEVVAKSYPEFWQHLEQVGFKTSVL